MNNVADDPWYMSAYALPVAKSCIDCGQFLDAHHFWSNGPRGRRPECSTCSRRRVDKPGRHTASRVPSTGIPVAKTCFDCGQFLEAQAFWGNGKPGRRLACRRCMKRRRYRYHQSKKIAA